MASNIDITKPTSGTATTQSVRDNFATAKTEIEALQSGKQAVLTFTPEDTANKSTSTADSGSSVKFPVWSAIVSFFSATQIRSILGISTLSGSNTGDQDLSSYVTKTGAETLTNKRITQRVGSTASSATPTINTDNVDIYQLTAQTADITSFTTNLSGTPTAGQKLIIEITGTAARAITWGASFESSTVTLPTTTVSTDKLSVGFIYNSATSKWRCVAVA